MQKNVSIDRLGLHLGGVSGMVRFARDRHKELGLRLTLGRSSHTRSDRCQLDSEMHWRLSNRKRNRNEAGSVIRIRTRAR